LIERVLARGYREPEAERLKAELDLKAQAQTTGGVEEARAAAAAHLQDRALRLKLAEALAAAGSYEDALDLCLDLVETDRKGVGEEAPKTMLAIFQLLPDDSELGADDRRRLSAALY
jgi:putative thioredoxin